MRTQQDVTISEKLNGKREGRSQRQVYLNVFIKSEQKEKNSRSSQRYSNSHQCLSTQHLMNPTKMSIGTVSDESIVIYNRVTEAVHALLPILIIEHRIWSLVRDQSEFVCLFVYSTQDHRSIETPFQCKVVFFFSFTQQSFTHLHNSPVFLSFLYLHFSLSLFFFECRSNIDRLISCFYHCFVIYIN